MTWVDRIWSTSFHQRPRAYRNRNGKVGPELRSMENWRMALLGHLEVRHNGKIDEACPACQELRAKLDKK